MIDLKRNTKGLLVPAQGERSTASSKYTVDAPSFRISRSKFTDFLSCQRCFYMDRVLGLDSPGMPTLALNKATDTLLKKEFDSSREEQKAHRLFKKFNFKHVVPFKHEEIDSWRNSQKGGLIYSVSETNIILTGALDDIWFDTVSEELIVVEYKSQASHKAVEAESYLSNPLHFGYKTQMDFYNYLLHCMGFKTSEISYFLVVNANDMAAGFEGKLCFEETIIPYRHDIRWIPEKIKEMVGLLRQKEIPLAHESCKNCAYSRRRAAYDGGKYDI